MMRGLCVGLVVALLQALVPAQDVAESIQDLKLSQWQPRSMLKTKVTQVNKPAFPVIDVHNHLGGGAERLTTARVNEYLQAMNGC